MTASINTGKAAQGSAGIAKSPDLEIIKVLPELLKRKSNRIQTHTNLGAGCFLEALKVQF